jgi:hypothetical protein
MPAQGSRIVAVQQMTVAGKSKQEREDVLGSTLVVTKLRSYWSRSISSSRRLTQVTQQQSQARVAMEGSGATKDVLLRG